MNTTIDIDREQYKTLSRRIVRDRATPLLSTTFDVTVDGEKVAAIGARGIVEAVDMTVIDGVRSYSADIRIEFAPPLPANEVAS